MTYQMRKNEEGVVDVIVEAFENLRPMDYSLELNAALDIVDKLADSLERSIGPRFRRDAFISACMEALRR